MKETSISFGLGLYNHSLTIYLLEGLSELSSRGHTQLLRDVSWNFEQEDLHQAGHHPVLPEDAEICAFSIYDFSIFLKGHYVDQLNS